MLKKYFYKTALTTAALSTAVLLSGCGQSAGTGTAKTNTITSAVSGLNMTAF
jgi:outer membrane murein-binding lipoprotein Lpp